MKTKEPISPIIMVIGGLFSIITVLPGVSNFLPITVIGYRDAIFRVSGTVSMGAYKANPQYYVTFWGFTKVPSSFQIRDSLPQSWTVLALPSIVMVLIFVSIGSLAILVAVIPSNKVAKMLISGLTSIFLGFIELIVLILILLGNNTDLHHFGFFNSYLGIAIIGFGYWILLLSTLLITIGGIVNIIIIQKTKFNKNNVQNESVPFISFIGPNFKRKVSKKEYPNQLSERTLNKMEELIKESKLEEEK